MENYNQMIIWDKSIPETNIEKFKKFVNEKHDLKFETFWDLHDWSVRNFELFWETVWNYYDIICSQKFKKSFQKIGPEIMDNEWFIGAKFNYAENLLRHRDNKIAITYIDEEEHFEEISYKEMYEEVKLYSAAFRKHGLKKGDVVACYISNRKETVFGMLAATSIGAIWGGPEPFAGTKLAKQILDIIKPKFLLTQEEFIWMGKRYNLVNKLEALVNDSSTLVKVIIVPSKKQTHQRNISHIKNSCFLKEFLESGKNSNGSVPELIFEQLPASHPIYVNFTSGTTGASKGFVHSAWALLSQLVDVFHWNIKEGDVVINETPVGWIIWNLLVISLAVGANYLLYNSCYIYARDGNLNVWDTISKYKVKMAVMVPSEIDIIEKNEIIPKSHLSFEYFQSLLLCASPATIQNYQFLLKYFKKNLFITNMYGTSETLVYATGYDFNMTGYALESQTPALGRNIKCLDKNGTPVCGKIGDMVLSIPCPALLTYMLNDRNNEQVKTYLTKHPGFWCPNDLCYINPVTKGIRVIGRCDSVIAQYGFIFSANEIYSVIHEMEEIEDYICVGQKNNDGDSRAVLFIKMKKDHLFTTEFVEKISKKIEEEIMEFFVPQVILEIPDIPYNFSRKRLEKVVETIVNTNKIPNVAKIRNPESLQHFVDIPILKDNKNFNKELLQRSNFKKTSTFV